MRIYNKYFNKWFLVNQNIENEKPVWKPGMNKSKHCLVAKMVIFEPSICMYKYAEVRIDKDGPVETVYHLVNLHKIEEVKGKFKK
jgi:hypothetical protein